MSDPAMTPLEASTRMQELQTDRAWLDRYLTGDGSAVSEFRQLSKIAGKADRVDLAMNGVSSLGIVGFADGDLNRMTDMVKNLRGIGVEDDAIRGTLQNDPVSRQDRDAMQIWKDQQMRSKEFTTRYMAGEPDAVKQMTNANIVLSRPIKEEIEK